MAAYAALVSLMNTMEQILNHPRLSNSLDKYQIEFLNEKISFFLGFIESYDSHGSISKEVEVLESQIALAAHAAEDVIESHIVDQIHAGSNKKSLICLLDLQRIIVEMDSIKENVMKVKEERGHTDQPTYSMPAASSRCHSTGKTTMVGFEAYLTQLLDGLTGHQSNRQIIPIVGMGGIGKTTLARNAYEHLLIVQHFDVRAWVTISQEYNVSEILFEILSCLSESSSGNTEDELAEKLYKTLSGRRYLIILDDMWSVEAWNKIKFFFPDNCIGSRIIVTTRLSDVAGQFGSLKLAMKLLNDDESWKLFCEKAFGEECCPHELEKVGKKIVKNCKGLPLSIIVIGGILGKSSRTQEYWANIAKDVSSILNSGENDECLNILSLSYSHLPACLKPCFLYLGIFPEDHDIHVSRLIKLWVNEGFLRPNRDQSLEEIAEGYIKDLVDRNLIFVRRLGKNGRLKTCYIHDLLRDLCLKIAEQEKFLYGMRVHDSPRDIDRERLIIYGSASEEEHYQPRVLHTLESTSFARSLIYKILGTYKLFFNCRLLKILLVDRHPHWHYLKASLQQVDLRSFAQEYGINFLKLPRLISLLWNVQTIIFHRNLINDGVAPFEIWEMRQLRHLMMGRFRLHDPPPSDDQDDCVVLRNLQTLQEVVEFRCSEEVIKRMPNIKKLKICYKHRLSEDKVSYYCLYNLDRLDKLESLEFFYTEWSSKVLLLRNLTFPSSLKKLHLRNCILHWNDLTIIGSLPHLEVLRFIWGSMKGAEWNSIEGEFRRLKYLRIDGCGDLIYWNADKSHFPVLQNLVLGSVGKLNEIPSGIGDIPTLESIQLKYCSVSVGISAVKILEEQESLGNQSLHLEVVSRSPLKQDEFREQMHQEGITVHNFRLN